MERTGFQCRISAIVVTASPSKLATKKAQIRLNLRLWRRWWAFEPTFQNAEKSAFWRESGEILRPLERTGERDSGSQNPSIQYVASDADKIKAAKDG